MRPGTELKRDFAKLVLSTPERVALIQRIFRESVEGHGYRAIADGLNRDGIPSPRDGNWSRNARSKWSVGTIRAILRNPAYRGDTVWNRRTFAKFHRIQGGVAVARDRLDADKPAHNHESDWIVVPNTHEATVSPEMFDRVQELTKARGRNASSKTFRAGSGMRSPYLLSGLIACGRCGQRYQGRKTNSTKTRKDGSRIATFYYCCGGHISKGNAVCKKYLLRKDPLEDYLLKEIGKQVRKLVAGDGERLLREFIAEEVAAQGQDPRREIRQLRARLREIDQKADVLLDGLTPETHGFINDKLRGLAAEKSRLQRRVGDLEAVPYEPLDADAVLADGLTALQKLPALMETASLEERKEFIHSFIAGLTVHPDEQRLEVQMRKIPAGLLHRPGNSSVGVVAGTGLESGQTPEGQETGSLRARLPRDSAAR